MPSIQTSYLLAADSDNRMDELDMKTLSGQTARGSTHNPAAHFRGFLSSYYRNSQRRSRESAARIRKRTRDQPTTSSINSQELRAAGKKIRRLEIELSYAEKQIAELKNTLREYGLPEKSKNRTPFPSRNHTIFVEGGIESDDYLQALAASLETMEQEILQKASGEDDDGDSVAANDGSMSPRTASPEPEEHSELSTDGPAPAQLPVASEPQDLSPRPALANVASLNEMMGEKQEALQKWMIDFCERKCYMMNNFENLETISDTIGQFSSELQEVIEQICETKIAEARNTLQERHAAETAELEAHNRDKETSLRSSLEQKHIEEQAQGIDEALSKREAELQGRFEKLRTVETAEIEARHKDEEAKLQSSLQQAYIQELAKGIERALIEREAELRAEFDKESEARVTKALDAWKVIYQPLAKIGALIADRKLAKTLEPSQRGKHWKTILMGNEAAHGGSVLADLCRFHDELPKGESSGNREGFHRLYGIDLELAKQLTGSEKIVSLLNMRASVLQCKSTPYRDTEFAARYEPLWKTILERFQGKLTDFAEFLSQEETLETIRFLEKAYREILRQDMVDAKKEFKLASAAKKQRPKISPQQGEWEESDDEEDLNSGTPSGPRWKRGRRGRRGHASGSRGGNTGHGPRGGKTEGSRSRDEGKTGGSLTAVSEERDLQDDGSKRW